MVVHVLLEDLLDEAGTADCNADRCHRHRGVPPVDVAITKDRVADVVRIEIAERSATEALAGETDDIDRAVRAFERNTRRE